MHLVTDALALRANAGEQALARLQPGGPAALDERERGPDLIVRKHVLEGGHVTDRAGRRALIAQFTGGTVSGDELEEAATATKGCTRKELQAMCKRHDRRWSAGSCADDLQKFDLELKRARPAVDTKFD